MLEPRNTNKTIHLHTFLLHIESSVVETGNKNISSYFTTMVSDKDRNTSDNSES